MSEKNNSKGVDIVFTDIQLHVATRRKPTTQSRAISKVINSTKKESGRFYTNNLPPMQNDELQIPLLINTEMQKIQSDYAKKGKEVKFFIPKEGIKVYLGDDTKEYIIAHADDLLDKNIK